MALGSMLGLLEAGARLHRFYLFAVVGAKGLTDLDSTSKPAAIDHAIWRAAQLLAAMGLFVALLVGAVVFALRRDPHSTRSTGS